MDHGGGSRGLGRWGGVREIATRMLIAHSLAAIFPTILIAPKVCTIGTYVSVPTYLLPIMIIHII